MLAAALAAEGVTRVFGIIDGTYMGFYAAFEKHGIELISPRHETSAAHMAGAYARSSGKLGVCMASNGPGAANILPGVAVESGEGNRVLLITSCRRTFVQRSGRSSPPGIQNRNRIDPCKKSWMICCRPGAAARWCTSATACPPWASSTPGPIASPAGSITPVSVRIPGWRLPPGAARI